MTRHPVLGVRLAVFILLTAVVSPVAADNLLLNGDFERPDEHGGAANWFTRSPGGTPEGEAKLIGGGYQSEKCLVLEGRLQPTLLGVFCTPIDVGHLPTDRLLFTCHARTHEQPQAEVALITFGQDFHQREWQTPYLQAEVQPIPRSQDWNLLSWYFEPVVGTQQVIVVVRVTGRGRLYIDQAALRPYPDQLSAQIQEAGILHEFPDRLRTTLRLTNHTDRVRQVQAVLIAQDEDGRGIHTQRQATIAADGQGLLSIPYRFALQRSHHLQIIVSDPTTGDIYEHQQIGVAGLIEAHCRQPAFRQTILSSIPIQFLEIAGRINATERIAKTAQLSARIAALDLHVTEDSDAIQRPTPNRFTIKLPLKAMLTGDYTVSLAAEFTPSRRYTTKLPVRRLSPSPSEVGYDVHNSLCINGTRVLPRGLYHVMQPENLSPIASAGFNFVVVPSRRTSSTLAEKANELGLSLLVASPTLSSATGSPPGSDFWQNLQDKFGNDPALLGWYVLARPDQRSVPPAAMEQLYQGLQQVSPHHPTLMALSSPSLLKLYSDFCDIVVGWSLPIPASPVTGVGQILNAAQQAVADSKPVWAAIQASGPGWYSDAALDIQGPGRAPTVAELRAMTYLALMHGAKGLIYYGYQIPAYPGTRAFNLPQDAPELWQAFPRLNRQLQWLAPVILNGQRTLLPAAAEGALHLATWQYNEGLYVVAVNTSDQGLVCHFQVPAAAGQALQTMFESYQLPASADGSFQDSFAPHEVHIYTAR